MPIKMPKPYEMVRAKTSSAIKNAVFDSAEQFAAKIPSASAIKGTTVDLVKRTVSATKERAKARGIVAGEVAVGGLVAKATTVAVGAITATGTGAFAVTAAPVVAGFTAACVAGGVLKTLIDGKTTDNE